MLIYFFVVIAGVGILFRLILSFLGDGFGVYHPVHQDGELVVRCVRR